MIKKQGPISIDVSFVHGEVRLTNSETKADARTIEVESGGKVLWIPADDEAKVLLLFASKEKPVSRSLYFGEKRKPITLTVRGRKNQCYKYAAGVVKEPACARPKARERKLDIPHKICLEVHTVDPVIIIR